RTQDPGFSTQDVAVASFELPVGSYNAQRTRTFFSRLVQDLSSTPELKISGLAAQEPLSNSRSRTAFRLPEEGKDKNKLILFLEASAGYFDVLRIPIVSGRNFLPSDADRHTILINETAARR